MESSREDKQSRMRRGLQDRYIHSNIRNIFRILFRLREEVRIGGEGEKGGSERRREEGHTM
jgi:hypothetical protein